MSKNWDRVPFSFVVPGEPVPQPRHRSAGSGHYLPAKHPVHAFKGSAAWCGVMALKAAAGAGAVPLCGPVSVAVRFYFGRPKRLKAGPPEHKHTKPDLDNLCKALFDALNKVVWLDDGQVVRVEADKFYCGDGEQARTEVTIS